MPAELFLCLCQEDAATPYRFLMTGVNVYSLEEAAYHCHQHWKQCYDEFTAPAFLEWVRDTLGLPFTASEIAGLDRLGSPKERLLAFLGMFAAADEIQLAALGARFEEWEKRLEWERLKERGDYLMAKNMPAKAIYYYKKALADEENAQLLNNMGVGLMSLSLFQEAHAYLERALALAPDNLQILLNTAEASIQNRDFDKAQATLSAALAAGGEGNADIQALFGELCFASGNIRGSVEYFEKAIAIDPGARNIFRLADIYARLRQYDRAMETLNRAPKQNRDYMLKLAALHHEAGNVPAALRTVERALMTYSDDPALWTKLATYHRLDYDVTRAHSAIIKALTLAPDNGETLLEHARIKKALGKTKEYRDALHALLARQKAKYRESIGV